MSNSTSGLTITRKIASGFSENDLKDLIYKLDSEYILKDDNTTEIQSIVEFKDDWLNKFKSEDVEFNSKTIPGMVLECNHLDIRCQMNEVGTKFTLPYEGGANATIYFPTVAYETYSLARFKKAFDDKIEESRKEQRSISSSIDNYEINIDTEPGLDLNDLQEALKSKKYDFYIGTLKMPKFKISTETDILNSEAFRQSPLYQMFADDESICGKFMGKLTKFTNNTIVTVNEDGSECISTTDMDCVYRSFKEPEEKIYRDIDINRRFWMEINNREMNLFTMKIVEPKY